MKRNACKYCVLLKDVKDTFTRSSDYFHSYSASGILEQEFRLFLTPEVARMIRLNFKKEASRIVRAECSSSFTLLVAVLKGGNEPITQLWSEKDGGPLFNANMSRNRFKTIIRFLRFDLRRTGDEPRKNSKLAPISEVGNCSLQKVVQTKFHSTM